MISARDAASIKVISLKVHTGKPPCPPFGDAPWAIFWGVMNSKFSRTGEFRGPGELIWSLPELSSTRIEPGSNPNSVAP
jgi:hypothetical protein